MPDTTDRELLRSIDSGSMSALGELFRRYHERLHAYCYRMTSSTDAADDLVQEIFLRVNRYAGTYSGQASVRSWLHRLAHNACLDYLRDRKRERTDLEQAIDAGAGHQTTGSYVERSDVELLHEALRRISPDKRTLLILSRFHDMKYRQIAEVLGTTEGAVKVSIHRAIKDLRQIIQRMESES